ncbi:MAG TPA: GTP-binding protein, partial [Dehalococcoidia bacterium]|nr:GTP-binding protein [Dehalococcoidia bacterium]
MKEYTTERIRNVVLLGHGSTGKTSLAEAALFATGAISRLGRVEEGNTVSDYDPDEIKRGISINLSVVPCEWKDHKVNLIDTPGYADFVGEVKGGVRAADTALIVVDASAGV